MSNFADIIEGPVETAVKIKNPENSEQPLRDCVKNALDNYFAQLDGELPSSLYDMVLEQVELPLFQRVMEFTGGNQSRAAKLLGISRGTLRKKLKIYDLL